MEEKLNMILAKLTELNEKFVWISNPACLCKRANQTGLAPSIGSSGEVKTDEDEDVNDKLNNILK